MKEQDILNNHTAMKFSPVQLLILYFLAMALLQLPALGNLGGSLNRMAVFATSVEIRDIYFGGK